MTPPHLCLHFVWLALTVIWIGHGFAAATTGSPIADLMAACRQCTRRSEITIPMICHSDWVLSSFWVSVASGITKATQLYNISAVLQRPTVIGPANEAALVSLAASNYSLIGTTVVDMDNVGSAVARVVANGSAVVTYNSGNMYIDRDGAMNHIGQTEYNAGFKLGARLATLGARQIYCLNQEIGDTSLAARCQGARDGAVSVNPSASVTLTYLDGTSNPSMIATINGLLDAHPNLDGFASLDQDMAIRTTAILAQRNLLGTVKVGTVDIGQGVLQQIQQGNISFAIDQQEVLQGFGTMLLLKTFYMTRGQMLLTKELLSGPAVVSSANVPQVMCRVDPTHPGCALTLPASITIGVVSLNSWTLTSAVTKQLQYGAMNAAREHGVKLLFIDTGIFDLQALALQVQAAVNAGSISALVMPIPSVSSGQDYGALADLAAAASIPVFSYGTGAIRGAPKVASGSIKFHLGQDESVSGARVGARLNAIMAPGTQVLCLSLELGSDDMQLKCAGTQTALSDGRSVAFQSGSGSLVLMLSPRDSGLSHATLSAALATNPNIGAIVFPNAETARTVVNVLAATTHATRASSIVIAGYGVNLDVMELIHAGTVAFTVDEQPFLQAYLGTAFAAYYLTDNLVLQNGLLETGPQFIDQSTLQSAICRADTDADPMAECPACPPLCSVNGRCLDSGICQCNSGWLFGPNADCQLKDPGLQFIAASSTIALTMICFCGAAVLVTLGCTVLIFRFRAIPIIKASSWGMEMIMQFGFALVYASPFLYIGPPTDVTCLLQPYILSIGFSIAIAPLLAKTLRIYILFHQVFHSRVMGSGRIFRTMAGIVVMVNLMICTAWAVLDRPLPTREAIAPGKTNMVCQSASGSVFVTILLSYNGFLILLGAGLGFVTRGVEERFNESRQIGITMYNLTGVAAIGIPLLLSSINNVTLFFSFFSAILLVAGLATQFILLWPKLSGIWVLETEFDGPKMAPLSSFTVSSSRSTSIRVNRQAKMVAAAMSMSSMTVQLERHTWETMTIVAHTRIVTGKLSELMALWSKSTVMYFRDLETRLPMLGILSSTQAPGVGQFLDLSLALFKLYSIVPVTASTNGGKGMVERSMSKTGKTSSFLNPEVAQPGAYSVIQIKMTSGLTISIKIAEGPTLELWTATLAKVCGYRPLAGSPSGKNVLSQPAPTTKASSALESSGQAQPTIQKNRSGFLG